MESAKVLASSFSVLQINYYKSVKCFDVIQVNHQWWNLILQRLWTCYRLLRFQDYGTCTHMTARRQITGHDSKLSIQLNCSSTSEHYFVSHKHAWTSVTAHRHIRHVKKSIYSTTILAHLPEFILFQLKQWCENDLGINDF